MAFEYGSAPFLLLRLCFSFLFLFTLSFMRLNADENDSFRLTSTSRTISRLFKRRDILSFGCVILCTESKSALPSPLPFILPRVFLRVRRPKTLTNHPFPLSQHAHLRLGSQNPLLRLHHRRNHVLPPNPHRVQLAPRRNLARVHGRVERGRV